MRILLDAAKVHEWFKPDGAFPASALKGFENKLGMNVSEALHLCLRVGLHLVLMCSQSISHYLLKNSQNSMS